MHTRMIQMVLAPNSRPLREHKACGMISAKMTMRTVERMRPVQAGKVTRCNFPIIQRGE